MIKKRAVSPVIATILLIMIVIVIALIILLWSRGFIKEAMTKQVGGKEKSVEQYCQEVGIKSIIQEEDENGNTCFGFTNIGTIPIYSFNIKLSEKDSGSTDTFKWSSSVNPGFSVILKDENNYCYDYKKYEKIELIPILLAKKKNNANPEPFECPVSSAISI